MNSIFIKLEDLGSIMEARLMAMASVPTTRKRQTSFRQMVALLKTLQLLPSDATPVALGMCVAASGRVGLVVNYVLDTKVEGSLP